MVENVNTGSKQVSRRVVVNAPASELYALVANPHRHHELDGSGTVGQNISGPEHVVQGDEFSTHMRQFGMNYRTTSTITQAETDRVIEWQLGIGQKWRWEFESLDENTTQVTETWDIREIPGVAALAFRIGGLYGRNGKGIEETLRRLQARYGE